jgi:transcriptional regulator
MYTPPAFRVEDTAEIHALMRAARSATLVTATAEGLKGTLLPMLIDTTDGPYGTLYAHLARANDQWRHAPQGEALAIFNGPEAYVSPNWYATKAETHKVVPTWNYASVHAYGPVEFFEDSERLLAAVTRLTNAHEQGQARPWAVNDAPPEFIAAQLKGIIGLRMPITRWDGKKKMSQNRNAADRDGARQGLLQSANAEDHTVAQMIPMDAR